jgi:1-acyl-sn-glycerol-3-phosphate acyltransferase
MSKLRHTLKLTWLNLGFYGGLVLITAVSIVFISLPALYYLRYIKGCDKATAARRFIWHYGRAWTKLLCFFVPVHLENCDRPVPKPCIITPNHQSFFDTYCFGFMPTPNIAFAVRAWPFRMPFYRPYMRLAGYLNTESGGFKEFLRQSRAILEKGACIGIFPEGHRSPNGEIQRFHGGAFHLSVMTGVPILPVCIDGTGAFLRKGGFILRPATIRIQILEPIYPEQFAAFGEEAPLKLRHATKAAIQLGLEDLRSVRPLVL